jgi:hypothetical protein
MYQTPDRVQVAKDADFGTPVTQEHMHVNGIVVTRAPFIGLVDMGITDDFGNLLPWHPVSAQGWAFTCSDMFH